MITIRNFEQSDFPTLKEIYQQGIDAGNATFQTHARDWDEWDDAMLKSCRLVAVDQQTIVGWAALSAVSNRCVYEGVAEVSIYVERAMRGQGVGGRLLPALILASEDAGIWTLRAGIFPENHASLSLFENKGFRILGIQEKLGKMHDKWRDVVLLERRSLTVGV